MKKINKLIIEKAIQDELNKELIKEAPFTQKIFDAPARALGAVKNFGAGLAGSMRLGAVNKQIERSAERINKDWQDAEEVLNKVVGKLGSSSNPNVKQKSVVVQKNVADIKKNIETAINKMNQVVKSGADTAQGPSAQINDDPTAFSQEVDQYGNVKQVSPVDRWIKSWGVDPHNAFSKPEKGKIIKTFMDLQAAGVNPFKVKPEQSQKILELQDYRMRMINSSGVDPFPNNEHINHVLNGTPLKPATNLKQKKLFKKHQKGNKFSVPNNGNTQNPQQNQNHANIPQSPPPPPSTPPSGNRVQPPPIPNAAKPQATAPEIVNSVPKQLPSPLKPKMLPSKSNAPIITPPPDGEKHFDITPGMRKKLQQALSNANNRRKQGENLSNVDMMFSVYDELSKFEPTSNKDIEFLKTIQNSISKYQRPQTQQPVNNVIDLPPEDTSPPVELPSVSDTLGVNEPNKQIPVQDMGNEIQAGTEEDPAFGAEPIPLVNKKKKRPSAKRKSKKQGRK